LVANRPGKTEHQPRLASVRECLIKKSPQPIRDQITVRSMLDLMDEFP
jgi:hypothetical protein